MDALGKWWSSVMDEQRVDRLKQCQVLSDVLQRCRQHQQYQNRNQPTDANKTNNIPYSSYEIDTSIPEGIRMMRYFDWRRKPPPPSSEEDHKNVDTKNVVPTNDNDDGSFLPCIREEHALWACRAIATGCGVSLVELKSCMDTHGKHVVLQSPSRYVDCDTNKGKSEPDQGTPCHELQRRLAGCVSTNAKQLQERVAAAAKTAEAAAATAAAAKTATESTANASSSSSSISAAANSTTTTTSATNTKR